jgi:hypothetical protein
LPEGARHGGPDVTPAAVLVDARVIASHDGTAEAVFTVRYANGALRDVVVGHDVVSAAVDALGVDTLAGLVGRPWSVLLG